MAIALPLLYVLSPLLPGRKVFLALMHGLVMIVGALFIVDFKLRKPTVMEMILLAGVVALAVIILIYRAQLVGICPSWKVSDVCV